jgi:translation elongation factor EF-Tu-like GTPase
MPECEDELVASTGRQAFRMMIEAVITITGRPGVHLGGEIESGVVQAGDHLDLLDDGELIGEVTCDAIGSLDHVDCPERCLVTVYCATLSPDQVREGQVLAATHLRRPGDAALPRSISAPLYRQQTAQATAFASHYAPLLMNHASDAPRPADSDHEA